MKTPETLIDAFLASATRFPDKPFLHFEGETLAYGQARDAVARTAGRLHALGVSPGDRVALFLANSPEFVTTYLAILWLGGIMVPVNTRYREMELHHMLEDSGARVLVTDPAGEAEARRVVEDLPSVEHVIVISRPANWGAAQHADPFEEPVPLRPDDPAVIGYTSGTTGRSKGAVLSHGNYCSNSIAVTTAWGWTESDHLLLVLPLFHTHGLGVGLHGTLVQGSTITLMRSFDAEEVLTTLRHGHITMFFGVPTMYSRLVAAADGTPTRLSGIRLLVSGSAPLSPQLLEDVERVFGHRILERYGMTETVMNLGNPLAGPRKAGSVGVPFPGIEARVADPGTGTPLGEGETGEVQLRGPNLSRGYWRNEEASADVWTSDGWFRTGDLGYRDEDGYYFLTGRAKELIISGGFNIYPREVEEVLESHPAVAQAAVFGMPDADFGEKVVAAVVLHHDIDPEALQEFCRERLAGFKKPRDIHVLESLPRNALGKVQKHLLRARLGESAAV